MMNHTDTFACVTRLSLSFRMSHICNSHFREHQESTSTSVSQSSPTSHEVMDPSAPWCRPVMWGSKHRRPWRGWRIYKDAFASLLSSFFIPQSSDFCLCFLLS